MTDLAASNDEVFVVDDDDNVREILAVVFSHEGYQVTGFAEGDSFLNVARARTPCCVILDVNMPGRSGLDILRELDARHYGAPVLIISAQGDIPMAVDAIRNGAYDFIEKPFDAETVVGRVRGAIETWKQPHGNNSASSQARIFPGHERLTPREREVLGQIAGGASNKEAGRRLNISPRTIEVHRARIMEKLQAKNAADLVRIVLTNGHGQ